jgi:hypothetical protein
VRPATQVRMVLPFHERISTEGAHEGALYMFLSIFEYI